ncbi:MAG: hypothetical protein KJ792_12755, partial [Actinobacteria bacterium]|nr:hypothetical protein [Actinomycetota bacterium]
EARELLAGQGIAARVVSAPCLEWFAEQDQTYRDSVLPPTVTARVSVEAGIALPWHKILGTHGQAISLEHFGASAAAEVLYEQFDITADAVIHAAHRSVASVRGEAPQAAAPDGVPASSSAPAAPGDFPADVPSTVGRPL